MFPLLYYSLSSEELFFFKFLQIPLLLVILITLQCPPLSRSGEGALLVHCLLTSAEMGMVGTLWQAQPIGHRHALTSYDCMASHQMEASLLKAVMVILCAESMDTDNP